MNSLEEMGKRAAEVKYRLQVLSTEEKNQALLLADRKSTRLNSSHI